MQNTDVETLNSSSATTELPDAAVITSATNTNKRTDKRTS